MKKILRLLLVLLSMSPWPSQAAKERVLAEVRYSPNSTGKLVIYDSLCFTYSGGRHSSYNPHYWYYLGGYSYNYFAEDGVYPEFLSLSPTNVYDSSYSLGVDFDTVKVFKSGPGGILALYHIGLRSYNADGTTRRIERIIPPASAAYGIDSGIRQDISYWNGRISKIYHQVHRGANWDTVYIRTVLYNFIGQVLVDSAVQKQKGGSFLTLRSAYYHYNTKGLPQSILQFINLNGTRDTFARTTYGYYPNGDLLSETGESWRKGQGFENPLVNSYTYTPGIPFYTGRYTSSRNGGTDSEPLISHVNTLNQIDSIANYRLNANAGVSLFQAATRYTYNKAGSPVLWEILSVDSKTGAGAGIGAFARWYYQQYRDTVASEYAFVTIFPNPTTGTLILHYPDYKPGASVSVTIFNMLGQFVYSESFIPQAVNTTITLGSGAVTGMYGIYVFGSGNSLLYKGKFLKL